MKNEKCKMAEKHSFIFHSAFFILHSALLFTMLYGLYLSATGIMTSSHRQDVIANNLANSETSGFKRDEPVFRQRLTAANESRRPGDWSDSVLEGLGGGLFVEPSHIDFKQGGIEQTGSPLDVAIQGDGFFAVDDKGKTRLTRDGRFQLDRTGSLIVTGGQRVLDKKMRPITLSTEAPVRIDRSGNILQGDEVVASLGVFDVPDKGKMTKLGNNLMGYPNPGQINRIEGTVHSEFIESSNVEPTDEMAQLMDSQRQLEANANMIHTQDSMLQLLVNNVGKIS
jgi:flagellar basal body rod protein FlgG